MVGIETSPTEVIAPVDFNGSFQILTKRLGTAQMEAKIRMNDATRAIQAYAEENVKSESRWGTVERLVLLTEEYLFTHDSIVACIREIVGLELGPQNDRLVDPAVGSRSGESARTLRILRTNMDKMRLNYQTE